MTTTATRPEAARARAAIAARTLRTDRWWFPPLVTFVGLSAWVIYATVRVFMHNHFFVEQYHYCHCSDGFDPADNHFRTAELQSIWQRDCLPDCDSLVAARRCLYIDHHIHLHRRRQCGHAGERRIMLDYSRPGGR